MSRSATREEIRATVKQCCELMDGVEACIDTKWPVLPTGARRLLQQALFSLRVAKDRLMATEERL